MKPLVWNDDAGCIELSYDPVLRDREQEVIDAAKQWIEIPCEPICFSAPVERALPDDGRPILYSIHFTELEPMGTEQSTAALWYRLETGQMDRALVRVDPTLGPEGFRRALLRGLGRAIGFDTPPMEIESVLHASSQLSALSSEDVRAFCAKYGTCY